MKDQPKKMREVTHIVNHYRDCARNVWNTYFRSLEDGWHEFINVKHELFYALVQVQIVGGHSFTGVYKNEFGSLLKIVPQHGETGIDALWAKRENQEWNWKILRIKSNEVELSYIDYFDFTEDNEYEDYQYIRTHICHYSLEPKIIGADMLLPANDVKIYYQPLDH